MPITGASHSSVCSYVNQPRNVCNIIYSISRVKLCVHECHFKLMLMFHILKLRLHFIAIKCHYKWSLKYVFVFHIYRW